MTIYHKNELDEVLQDKLALIASTPARNPEKAIRGREVFMNHAKEIQTRGKIPAEKASTGRAPKHFWGQRPAFYQIVVALSLALVLLFGGAWGAAYAAQDSLPNQFLYPVKLAEENLMLALAIDGESKIELLSTYTTRRVEEAISLALQKEPIPTSLSTRLEAHYEALFSQAAQLDDAAMLQTLDQLHIRLRTQDQDMSMVMKGLPDHVDPQLVRLQAMLKANQQLAQAALGDPNTFRHQFRHQEGSPTPSTTPQPTRTAEPTPHGTQTRTPGQYGPGPCETPGACTPAGDSAGPGPHAGTPTPGDPGQHGNQNQGSATPQQGDGYGPGPQNGEGPQGTQSGPEETPTNTGQPSKTPQDDGSKNNKGSNKDKNKNQ